MLFLVHVNNSYNFHTNWDHLKYELKAVSISKLVKHSSRGYNNQKWNQNKPVIKEFTKIKRRKVFTDNLHEAKRDWKFRGQKYTFLLGGIQDMFLWVATEFGIKDRNRPSTGKNEERTFLTATFTATGTKTQPRQTWGQINTRDSQGTNCNGLHCGGDQML